MFKAICIIIEMVFSVFLYGVYGEGLEYGEGFQHSTSRTKLQSQLLQSFYS